MSGRPHAMQHVKGGQAGVRCGRALVSSWYFFCHRVTKCSWVSTYLGGPHAVQRFIGGEAGAAAQPLRAVLRARPVLQLCCICE